MGYDGTVRDSSKNIIQFQYGDDGMDACTLEKVPFGLVEDSYQDLMEDRIFTSHDVDKKTKAWFVYMTEDAVKEMKRDFPNWEEAMMDDFRDLIKFRHRFLEEIHGGSVETKIHYPVHVPRILTNVVNMFGLEKRAKAGLRSDISPMYIITQIEALLDKLDGKTDSRFQKFTYNPTTGLLRYLLKYHLPCVKLIKKYRLCKHDFNTILGRVMQVFHQSLIHPGESVGPVSAQSIGEPSTQMSQSFRLKILAACLNTKTMEMEMYNGTIGNFIDNLVEKYKKFTYPTGHGPDSIETSLEKDEDMKYYIVSVDENEKLKFSQISHVSRHPTNGDLMEIETRSGRVTTTTYSHSHLMRTEDSIVPILGSNLKVGHRVPVAKNIKLNDDMPRMKFVTIGIKHVNLDEEFGWFLGAYLSEGSIANGCIKITSIKPHFETNTQKIADYFGRKLNVQDIKFVNMDQDVILHLVVSPLLTGLLKTSTRVPSKRTYPAGFMQHLMTLSKACFEAISMVMAM